MVIIRTNCPQYRNDIAEEITLFLGIVDTQLLKPDDLLPEDAQLAVTAMMTKQREEYQLYVEAKGFRFDRTFFIDSEDLLQIKKHEKRQLKLAVFALLKELYPELETPWGSLTGIRPTKLFRELSLEADVASAAEQFEQVFCVSPEKTGLARTICQVQQPYISEVGERDLDVYIGIPFCRTRCLYCSFISQVMRSDALLKEYLSALKTDILAGAALAREAGYRVRAMYVGGGTPTVLSAAQLEDLLATAFSAYGGFGLECTVEAGRPDTIDRDKLAVLKRLGVERISINPQSMNDETLRRIGRDHTVAETVSAYHLAREIGFKGINMDLIAGLPGEDLADTLRTYDAILPLAPENLTIHTLTVKRSSLLKRQLSEYALAEPQEAAEMVAAGAKIADRLDMQPYYMYRQKYMRGNLENVGYAQPGHVCRYNIDMMEETASIMAHGAGSMSKRVFGGTHRIERLPNPKDVPTYLDKLPEMLRQKSQFFFQ